MNYTNILQWDYGERGGNGNSCSNCFFSINTGGDCGDHEVGPCKGGLSPTKYGGDYWHYANAEQIKGLIEEAEKGYEWSKANGLWVCGAHNTCEDRECGEGKPHKYNAGRCTYGVCHSKQNNGFGIMCIPYRGEPKEDGMNEVASNAMELDYRVVKSFTTCGLRNSSISILVLGKLYREYGERSFTKGEHFLYTDPNVLGELLLYSYIEAVVDDPVVKVGDTFRYHDSADRESYFRVIPCDHGWIEFMCIYGAELGSSYFGNRVKDDCYINLSQFVTEKNLHLFKPCKIEIREVEE